MPEGLELEPPNPSSNLHPTPTPLPTIACRAPQHVDAKGYARAMRQGYPPLLSRG